MIQFLNNIWVALSTPNKILVNILVLPLFPIESTLLMYLFLTIFNINSNKRQRIIYMICNSFISVINSYFISSPYNVSLSIFIILNLSFKYNKNI